MKLVRGVDTSPARRAVVAGIVGITEELGITVLAEGLGPGRVPGPEGGQYPTVSGVLVCEAGLRGTSAGLADRSGLGRCVKADEVLAQPLDS
ncbi:hypothetical protein P5G52_01360 [Arthrobacter sp. IIF3SC--B10]|uniref:Uncharacterized protein n=1 Tax=Arthrobacter burdickii TaxID=3035920 RepID=A0ABT8JWF8_9MICC|nr:hypothetical protein [Arthrobacter burdickii]MDN4609506.1 hypothetical protein [Arthrobacter burdickii]